MPRGIRILKKTLNGLVVRTNKTGPFLPRLAATDKKKYNIIDGKFKAR
jgi:hypothetical protein